MILHLESIANNAPNAFVDIFNVKVSNINLAMNVFARISIDKSPTHVVELLSLLPGKTPLINFLGNWI